VTVVIVFLFSVAPVSTAVAIETAVMMMAVAVGVARPVHASLEETQQTLQLAARRSGIRYALARVT
jgi:hypothetical protein